MEYRYTAIILGKKDVGETDRIYTAYTREFGKVQVFGRGVRKPHARLAGQLENFNTVSLMVMRSRGMGNIKAAVIEDDRAVMKGSYEVLREVFGGTSLFLRFVDLEQKDEALFDLLVAYLDTMKSLAQKNVVEKISLAQATFLFQSLTHLGHGLEVYRCVICGDHIQMNDHFFSIRHGGVVCGKCASESARSESREISLENIKLLRLIRTNKVSSMGKISVEEKHLRSLHALLREYIRWIE